MGIRPSENWRARVVEEPREVAAGTLDPACAYMAQLFPESLLKATDTALQSFEAEVGALGAPTDEQVFQSIKRVVLILNVINEDHGGAGYETGEREELCEYRSRMAVDETTVRARAVDAVVVHHAVRAAVDGVAVVGGAGSMSPPTMRGGDCTPFPVPQVRSSGIRSRGG